MAIVQLSSSQAFNPGADLWIIGNDTNSKMNLKIDWYLNFQLSKSRIKTKTPISAFLKKLVNHCEIPLIDFGQNNQQAVMFDSSHHFPNRWIIQVDKISDTSSWCQKINNLWLNLKKPSIRVFLPTGLSASEFQTRWREVQSFDDFTVVID